MKADLQANEAHLARHDALNQALDDEWLEIRLAGARYAIPLMRIREIVTPRAITRVPRALPSVLGLMSVRGRLVTIYDPRHPLGLPRAPGPMAHATNERTARILLARQQDEEVGIRADEVLGVLHLRSLTIEPSSILGGGERPYLKALARIDGRALLLLDLDSLLRGKSPL